MPINWYTSTFTFEINMKILLTCILGLYLGDLWGLGPGSWLLCKICVTLVSRLSDECGTDQKPEPLTFLQLDKRGATLGRMDCSEEPQCVSEEPIAQLELKKGMSIFIDVSRTISHPHPDFKNWLHLYDDVLTWGTIQTLFNDFVMPKNAESL